MTTFNEVVQKLLNLGLAKIVWVALFMEKDVLATPVDIARCCTWTVLTSKTGKTDLFKELRFLVRVVWN